MCALALDVGTMFLVKGELDPLTDEATFTTQRNAFLEVAQSEDTEETLKNNNWAYAKYDNNYYVLGEDALKLKNLLSVETDSENKDIVFTQVGKLRRPMKDGVLNTGEEKLSVAIIQKIIHNLIGKPKKKGETICFCAPGKPVDRDFTILFHETMVKNALSSLGYNAECIPEALAIIFSEKPIANDPEEGEQPYSGIGISFGAGMCNVCFAWKKMPLINFSIAQAGDWIDREAARSSGIPISAMTSFKERKFDLAKVDYSDMRQASLDIFYQAMIKHALQNFAIKFNSLEKEIDSSLEIVVAGGTATIPGFLEKFKTVLDSMDLPFDVAGVRLADSSLYAVANGCLLKAINIENKAKSDK